MKITAKLVPGKVAVITGGSSGIGKAISCEFAKRGMDVWLVAQRRDILESARLEVETYRQNQNQLIDTVSADVTDLAQVKKAIEIISERSATLDILINSAGVAHPGYVQELDINIFNWMMEVNYFGTVNMTKEVLRIMLPRSSGYIVNISSMAGINLHIWIYSIWRIKICNKRFLGCTTPGDEISRDWCLHSFSIGYRYSPTRI